LSYTKDGQVHCLGILLFISFVVREFDMGVEDWKIYSLKINIVYVLPTLIFPKRQFTLKRIVVIPNLPDCNERMSLK
jgi:hypothetical protein